MPETPLQEIKREAAAQPSLLARYRQRYAWLDHLVRSGQTYTRNNGNHYAAAITYFSVLSLFPLLMIAFAGAAFVLAYNQQLLSELEEQIRAAAPPDLAITINALIDEAIASRHSIGMIGLLVALYAGLGWMSNLREAVTAQWGQRHEPSGFLRTKLFDLLALFGLELALLVSFGLTSAGAEFAGVLLDLASLADLFRIRLVLSVLAIALSLAGTWLVFLWVLARLPRKPVPLSSAIPAALLGTIGFELLKQLFSIYLDIVLGSPTGRIFGPIIGLMVFVYFVSRFLLFVTAWAATAKEGCRTVPVLRERPDGGPPNP